MPESIESVFDLTAPPDCSIFAPTAGYGADTFVSFVRSSLRVNTLLSQPRLNSAGETSLSYAPLGTFLGSLQPTGTNYQRFVHGTVVELNYRFIIVGYADVKEGDRCMISGARMEVKNVQRYGSEQTEIDLGWVGR